jgi:crotonobetainyl-CoA:carnitine CoA-transferase CaiB-like acyl-CoA transferase
MTVDLPHPVAGGKPTRLIASPIKLSETPVEYRRAPPTLGEHTEEVLEELLGLAPSEIEALRERGVV